MSNPSVLIIGSGAAGLTCALRLAEAGLAVTVVSKGPLAGGSTLWAQGGISAVLDATDSVESHIRDTQLAGAGLCDPDAVRFTVTRGAESIRWLIDRGVQFSIDESDPSGGLHLTREGGHSHRRIVHAADETGLAVETTLCALAEQHPLITAIEHHVAIDLILDPGTNRACGAYLLDTRSEKVRAQAATAVVLATGGANQVYLYSSNPNGASGDGIAMAWRAGCRVANMEFMQFHPTTLYHPARRNFLISEALRGEGATLRLPDALDRPGTRFMPEFDSRAELAPRDVVARAIDSVMKRDALKYVYLDIRHKSAEFITHHFPGIHRECLALGLDITRQAIPVVPSAHFTCGGVMTDLNGATDLPGLYAVGEVACTGLHGANRLASNSLLECLVFGQAAARHILSNAQPESPQHLPAWDDSQVTDSDEEIVVAHNWHELRTFMWDYVGIKRTNKRLARAQHRIQLLADEIGEYYGNFKVTPDLLELRNLLVVADLIVRSAMMRCESRGLHFNADYPEGMPTALPTVLPGRRQIRAPRALPGMFIDTAAQPAAT